MAAITIEGHEKQIADIKRERDQYTATMSAQVNQQIGAYNGMLAVLESQLEQLRADLKNGGGNGRS